MHILHDQLNYNFPISIYIYPPLCKRPLHYFDSKSKMKIEISLPPLRKPQIPAWLFVIAVIQQGECETKIAKALENLCKKEKAFQQ